MEMFCHGFFSFNIIAIITVCLFSLFIYLVDRLVTRDISALFVYITVNKVDLFVFCCPRTLPVEIVNKVLKMILLHMLYSFIQNMIYNVFYFVLLSFIHVFILLKIFYADMLHTGFCLTFSKHI